MSQEQLGRAAFISGDMIAKVERGDRSPSAKLVEACEQVTDLGSNGMLTLLWDQLGGFARPFPGWFARWPDAESAARTLRSFEPLIIPGLLQTEDYARALLSTRVGESEEQIDAMVAARLARQAVLDQDTALAGQILESADEIESLMLTWDTLRSEALSRNASMALIERVQETWT
jgi:transcriptional regulator with XRE-family HTH domain